MERRGHLKVPVIGVARSDWTIEKFRARALASVKNVDGFDAAVFVKFQLLADIDGRTRPLRTSRWP